MWCYRTLLPSVSTFWGHRKCEQILIRQFAFGRYIWIWDVSVQGYIHDGSFLFFFHILRICVYSYQRRNLKHLYFNLMSFKKEFYVTNITQRITHNNWPPQSSVSTLEGRALWWGWAHWARQQADCTGGHVITNTDDSHIQSIKYLRKTTCIPEPPVGYIDLHTWGHFYFIY